MELHSISLNNSNANNQNFMSYQLIINDKEYLLRCALTYNWDSLIKFCDLLLDVLNENSNIETDNMYNLTSSLEDPTNNKSNISYYSTDRRGRLSRRQYKYIDAAKEQLLRKDQWGNNPLHAACYNNPPLRVVTSLLRCASSAGLSNYLTSLSRDLSTPLNIACATGSSTDVIRVLLNPPRGIEPGGSAVTIPDARGCTPLSELVVHYELQRKSPSYFAGRGPAPSLDNVNFHNNHRNVEDPFFESFWIKVDMIIRAAWYVSLNHNTNIKRNDSGAGGRHRQHHPHPWISILHGAANIADSCPISLMLLICRSYPTMVNAYTVNSGSESLLPLHLAILANCCDKNHFQLVKQKTCFIKELIEYCPQAAQQPFPHFNGRSLFCQAISIGLSWNLLIKNTTATTTTKTKTIDSSDKTATTETKGPLAYIWDHVNPEVLIVPDITTGLVPFLLAAASKSASASSSSSDSVQTPTKLNQDDDNKDILQLDTIFELLRLHPQVLGDIINDH